MYIKNNITRSLYIFEDLFFLSKKNDISALFSKCDWFLEIKAEKSFFKQKLDVVALNQRCIIFWIKVLRLKGTLEIWFD